MVKTTTVMVLFFFSWFVLFAPAMADDVKGKGKRIRGVPHLCFPVPTAKSLLTTIKTLRYEKKVEAALVKKKMDIKDRRLKLKDERAGWYKYQMGKLEKAKSEAFISAAKFEKELGVLRVSHTKIALDAAKYRGQRYQYLVWGLVIGAGTATVVFVAIGVVMAVK